MPEFKSIREDEDASRLEATFKEKLNGFYTSSRVSMKFREMQSLILLPMHKGQESEHSLHFPVCKLLNVPKNNFI